MGDALLRRLKLRIRRGLVWYPRRCRDCRRWHLNGRYVSMPMCTRCFAAWQEARDAD